jgi:hypothetical protein
MEEKPRPKRGAPFGNKNSLKHGFYSRIFAREERRKSSSSSTGRLQPEIDLCKVIISRVAQSLKPVDGKPDLSFHEDLTALYVVAMAVARLNNLYRTNETLYSESDADLSELLTGYCVNI